MPTELNPAVTDGGRANSMKLAILLTTLGLASLARPAHAEDAATPNCDPTWLLQPDNLRLKAIASGTEKDGERTFECKLPDRGSVAIQIHSIAKDAIAKAEGKLPDGLKLGDGKTVTLTVADLGKSIADPAVLAVEAPNDGAKEWAKTKLLIQKDEGKGLVLSVHQKVEGRAAPTPDDQPKKDEKHAKPPATPLEEAAFTEFLVGAQRTTTILHQLPKQVGVIRIQRHSDAEADVTGVAPQLKLNIKESAREIEVKKEGPDCTQGFFSPTPGSLDDEKLTEECKGKLCITPGGKVYGLTDLTDRTGTVDVQLWVPESAKLEYTFAIDYEKPVIDSSGLKPATKPPAAGSFRNGEAPPPQRRFHLAHSETLKVRTAGKIKVSIGWKNSGDEALVIPSDDRKCVAQNEIPLKKTFEVSGSYYFMLGFMPTYAGLFDRKNTLHRSDDGVQRLFQQDVQEVDYAATLSAFPWGVEEGKTKVAVGALLGTSVRNPGKRWYLGLNVSTPINIGIVGGAGLIVVDELDRDFVVGQPLEDTTFPTHSTIVPTWFLGVNVEAELFRKAFKGIVGND